MSREKLESVIRILARITQAVLTQCREAIFQQPQLVDTALAAWLLLRASSGSVKEVLQQGSLRSLGATCKGDGVILSGIIWKERMVGVN